MNMPNREHTIRHVIAFNDAFLVIAIGLVISAIAISIRKGSEIKFSSVPAH
jgi:hypothetical protein